MIAQIYGKLIVKVSIILGLMAAVIFAAIWISDGIMRRASDDMRVLAEGRVPDLLVKTDLLGTTVALQQGFADLVLAGDAAAVQAASDRAMTSLDLLRAEAAGIAAANAQIAGIRDVIALLTAARITDFETDDAVAAGIAALQGHIEVIAAHLAEREDIAFFDLAINGETTIDDVGRTLDGLVENDFSALSLALHVQSATRDLAGITLALGQTADPGIRTILTDLMLSSQAEIAEILPQLGGRAELAQLAEPVTRFLAAIEAETARVTGRTDVAAVLAARGEVDRVVVNAIDEIEFNLFLAAADAKDSNEATIRALVDVQVAQIRDSAALATAVRQAVILTLTSVVQDSPDQVSVIGTALRPLLAQLAEKAEGLVGAETDLAERILALVQLSDPAAGLPALRLAGLEARQGAATLAADASAATVEVATLVSSALQGELTQVTASAESLLSDLAAARDRMLQVGAGAAGLVLVAMVLTWATVVRPLGLVTRLTERLAAGDLSPVTGMDRWTGEVGRMVTALRVFRDGMSERARLEAERQQAEAEAGARAQEQDRVVATLAQAFQRMAEGDLDLRIGQEFPREYGGLRDDFNAAIQRLSGLLRAVAEMGDHIRGSSREILGASDHLSRQTEGAAITLQTTVEDLSGLARSVRDTAERVADAAKLGSEARRDAEASVSVLRNSLELMTAIADAFKRISAVIGMIDDIAFQTNLLALNAGVEAARAGDAGRGFAVVAAEVRALAQRSSSAARDIKQLIFESDSLVVTGVEATDRAGRSLTGIIDAVIAMADRIEQISASSNAQSATIAEVSRAAAGLDGNMQSTVALFEETTAASRLLSEEAQVLAGRLEDFRLPPGNEAGFNGAAGDDAGANPGAGLRVA